MDPGIFARGGVQARLPENSSDNILLLVFNLFGCSMVISKKTMIVPRFQWGSNIFKGGGVHMLISIYRNPYNL